jgi:NADH-quinone oxidoreductase subunit C
MRNLTPVDVPPGDWYSALRDARERGFTYLDLLTVIDRVRAVELVAHLVNLDQGTRMLMTTTLPDGVLSADSITPLFPGANWHEREAAELFGIEFDGHPDPRPLLTRIPAAAPPMRRSTPLAARTQTPWPGAPSDDAASARGRRQTRVPGVLDSWQDSDS